MPDFLLVHCPDCDATLKVKTEPNRNSKIRPKPKPARMASKDSGQRKYNHKAAITTTLCRKMMTFFHVMRRI